MQLLQRQKSEASGNHQRPHNRQRKVGCLEVGHRIGECREARIAEGADRMEERRPCRIDPAETWYPEQIQKQCSDPLDRKREEKDIARQPLHIDMRSNTYTSCRYRLVPQRHASPYRHDDHRGKGDHAETAKLDQQQQIRLPEPCKIRGGVDNRQACNADRAGDRQECIDPAEALAAVESRQGFDADRAENDRKQKGACKELGRGEPVPDARCLFRTERPVGHRVASRSAGMISFLLNHSLWLNQRIRQHCPACGQSAYRKIARINRPPHLRRRT